jgi:carbonic anhydrase
MKKQLFLICPTTQAETFIMSEFGEMTYFLTSLGGVFNFNQIEFIEAVTRIIQNEDIREIVIVHDTSCHFIKSIFAKEKGHGTYAEKVLVDLLIDNYSSIMQQEAERGKRRKLAELNVQRQAEELISSQLIQQFLFTQELEIKGLVTTKNENLIEEVALNIHEYS